MPSTKKITKKKIGFTTKPHSKRIKQQPKKNPIDLHFEIVKKIDALIEENDKESSGDNETTDEIIEHHEENEPHDSFIEKRLQISRKIELSSFDKEIKQDISIGSIKNSFKIDPSDIKIPNFRFITKLEPHETSIKIKDNAIMPQSNIELLNRLIKNADTGPKLESKGFFNIKPKNKEENKKTKEQNTKQNVEASSSEQVEDVINKARKKRKKIGSNVEESKKIEEEPKKRSDEEQSRIAEELKLSHEVNDNTKQEELENESEKLEEFELKSSDEFNNEDETYDKSESQLEINFHKKDLRSASKQKLKGKKIKHKQSKKSLFGKRKSEEKPIKHKKSKINLFGKKQEHKPRPHHTHQMHPKRHPPRHSRPDYPDHEIKNFAQIEFDEDVKKVLLMTDDLLGKLPEDVIEDFANSNDFKLYEKVLSRYKNK